MNVYMSDDEQVQLIKDWWKKHGTTVLLVIIVFLGVSFGWKYWRQATYNRAERASLIYEQMFAAGAMHKSDDFNLYAKLLVKDYAKTPYASLAALVLARDAVTQNKLNVAQQHLQWVIDNSNSDSLRQIARLREARVLIALKQPQQALQLLSKVDDKNFASMIDETVGDVYLALGSKKQALANYQAALHATDPKGPQASLLQMKISAIASFANSSS